MFYRPEVWSDLRDGESLPDADGKLLQPDRNHLSTLIAEQLKNGSMPSVSTKELDNMIEKSEEIQRIIIEEAEAMRIRKEFWFTVAGIIVYSRYAVGIILGLIGGLLGTEIGIGSCSCLRSLPGGEETDRSRR